MAHRAAASALLHRPRMSADGEARAGLLASVTPLRRLVGAAKLLLMSWHSGGSMPAAHGRLASNTAGVGEDDLFQVVEGLGFTMGGRLESSHSISRRFH